MKSWLLAFFILFPTLAYGQQECADTDHYHLCGGPKSTPVPTAIPTVVPTPPPPLATPTPVTAYWIQTPSNGATVSGTVNVTAGTTMDTTSDVWWNGLSVDDVLTTLNDGGHQMTIIWDSTTVSNGTHKLTMLAHQINTAIVTGTASVMVNVNNTAPKPTATPPPIAGLPVCDNPANCAKFPLSDAQAKAYTDQYFPGQPFIAEKISQNTAHNSIVPTAAQIAAIPNSNLLTANGNRMMHLLTGACYPGGTTQQIISCNSIKWGYPPRMFWAEAFNESGWSHSAIGDIGVGVSLGILQNKSSDFAGTCPGVTQCPSHNYGTDSDANNYAICPGLASSNCLTYQSTNFGVEFALFWQHSCMTGDTSYLRNGVGGTDRKGITFPPYQLNPGNNSVMNDKWGCTGVWYSGQWNFGQGSIEWNLSGRGYHTLIQDYYCCQPYDAAWVGFGNGSGGSGSGCSAVCPLP